MCKEGKQQSPVNFDSSLDTVHGCPGAGSSDWRVNVSMPAMNAVNVSNLGHTVRWTPADGVRRGMVVNGIEYSLIQFHIHTPSEHHVDNMPFDAEWHFYHTSASGHTAVLTYLIEASDTNHTEFQVLFDEVPIHEGESEAHKDKFTATHVLLELLARGGFYSYNGSLTSPNCDENVRWIVAAAPLQLGRLQIRRLARTVGFSARPPQENQDLLGHRRPNATSGKHFNSCQSMTSGTSATASLAPTVIMSGAAAAAVWLLASWI
ncbi:alpha carbonic anhydrase [Catenaria anguillulae PL171]|uniref:carbonic anhydrase n=1 Tax=Catenaria anguillulae PL171 TaxID=765915 RepID=A0A1Y2I1W1_9FUNG|nr:alpha carbonic anhydrase [Catenaria anguillulae PL171]